MVTIYKGICKERELRVTWPFIMISFFQKIIDVLDQNNIPYMLSGSIAMSLYIVPRMTRDIDFIIHLDPLNLDSFADSFKDGFYCDRDTIKEAIETSLKMFNILNTMVK